MSGIVKWGGGFLAVCFLFAMYGASKKEIEAGQQVHEDVQRSEPAAATAPTPSRPLPLYPAATLIKAYDKNEVAADNLYGKKRMRIAGNIHNIGKDIMGDPYFTVGEAFKSANCYLDKEHANIVATLNKGDAVVFEGECDGLTMGSVVFRECRIPSDDELRRDYPDLVKQIEAPKKKRRRAADDDE